MVWTILLLSFSTLLCLGGFLLIGLVNRRLKLGDPVPVSPPDPVGPLVSVIVPVRNEERNIRRCIESLLAQTHTRWEAIIVDDHSTDRTAEIAGRYAARDGRIRILPSRPLPDEWVGKSHALAQGAARARGTWLCFLDADTFGTPDLLASTIAEAQTRQADLLSILTDQELKTFWEKVISPVAFSSISLVYNLDRINDPRQPDAMAVGQFILIRREAYESTGGHHALRNSILEDRALAESVKRAGHAILLKDGRPLASTRMHTSLKEIWESWVKTVYPGMRDQPEVILFLSGAMMAGAVLFPLWWIAALAWLILSGSLAAGIVFAQATCFWLCFLGTRAADMAGYNISPGYALTAPVGLFFFGAMMVDSYSRVRAGRGLPWKGRTYQTK
jgi:chlorobactene glucosyltransferase